jgi:molybdate-binding protein
MLRYPAFLWCCFLVLSSCSDLKKIPHTPSTKNISAIKFLDKYEIPYNLSTIRPLLVVYQVLIMM